MLNQPYEMIHFQGIATRTKVGELAMASRFGATYSENNMGFGEGRVLYMVDLLENAPEQSLFVLEEPETSLHEDAQHRLARYLLDVVNRRHHQIIVSTHSGTMLAALPASASCLIHRDAQGVSIHPGISSTRARAVLSAGHERLDIIVEDNFARSLLTEIIRAEDSGMLQMIAIEGIGSHDAVREALRLLGRLNRNAVGFVDGDSGPDPEAGVACLPGDGPPERELFEQAEIQQMLQDRYGIGAAHLTVNDPEIDHHDYAKVIGNAVSLPPEAVTAVCAETYARECLTQQQRRDLIDFIRGRIED